MTVGPQRTGQQQELSGVHDSELSRAHGRFSVPGCEHANSSVHNMHIPADHPVMHLMRSSTCTLRL